MRRLALPLLIVAASILPLAGASAQTTDLAAGLYVDQLTGFAVSWDPAVFTGEIPEIGGVSLTGTGTTGQIMTTTAATPTDCVMKRQASEGLGEAEGGGGILHPSWPEGAVAVDFIAPDSDRPTVLVGCIPVGPAETATFFLIVEIRGPGSVEEWETAVNAWQPVIDSIVLPDPAFLTSIGISGDTYTDPLFGWSVRFDPARYEAQYGVGTSDSAFISGLFLYAESDTESGGIWTERHDTIDDCMTAQRAVNEGFAGFEKDTETDYTGLVRERMTAALYRFEVDESLIFLNFTACQPLLAGESPVDKIWLVVSFSVPDYAFDAASAAWSTMLDSLAFGSMAPGATPAG